MFKEADQGMNTRFVNKLAELNLTYIYALRSIGCGKADGSTFSAVMNLAAPNAKIQSYIRISNLGCCFITV